MSHVTFLMPQEYDDRFWASVTLYTEAANLELQVLMSAQVLTGRM